MKKAAKVDDSLYDQAPEEAVTVAPPPVALVGLSSPICSFALGSVCFSSACDNS